MYNKYPSSVSLRKTSDFDYDDLMAIENVSRNMEAIKHSSKHVQEFRELHNKLHAINSIVNHLNEIKQLSDNIGLLSKANEMLDTLKTEIPNLEDVKTLFMQETINLKGLEEACAKAKRDFEWECNAQQEQLEEKVKKILLYYSDEVDSRILEVKTREENIKNLCETIKETQSVIQEFDKRFSHVEATCAVLHFGELQTDETRHKATVAIEKSIAKGNDECQNTAIFDSYIDGTEIEIDFGEPTYDTYQ